MAKVKSEDEDLASLCRKTFGEFESAWDDNHSTYRDDVDFALLENQWPDNIKSMRARDNRPMLTINKLKAFGRQVINDARQNKPSISVHPVDSSADPETADVFNGLIRNIEYTSNADVAYDTASECAVWGGFGYWRVVLDYAYEDAAYLDILIRRIANPLSVYGDPNSTEADSSDWDEAFVIDTLTHKQFEGQYGDRAKVSVDDGAAWTGIGDWRTDKQVLVAEWWKREKVDRPIIVLSDGTVLDKEEAKKPEIAALIATNALQVAEERVAKSCKVTQRIMSGVEVLKTTEWPGRFIPIVPVYGDEFNVDGKRYFRSLIHSAIDAQRMYNYWRSNATELVGLAPRAPFIGPKGAFLGPEWKTANSRNHAFLEYDPKVVAAAGGAAPQRQPMDMGGAAGSLQEALNAADDVKSTIGMYDASLGARSNETSGKAILARQREGDVATFHFIDNKNRAIRHTGRILIDLIPKIYTGPRIVRVLGEDGMPENKPINQEYQAPELDANGKPAMNPDGSAKIALRMHDLNAGKYDLAVETGPSFTTRREEAAASMTEAVRAYPESAPVILPELAKNLDWPGADKIAEKLEAQQQPQIPPEVQQQIDEGAQRIQQLEAENQQLKSNAMTDEQKIASNERMKELEIASEERTARLKIESDARLRAYAAQIQAEASITIAANKPAPQPAQ